MNCIYPDCTEKTYSRGLCLKHYQVARTLVRSKKTTWEVLVKNKKANDIGIKKKQTDWFMAPPEASKPA